MLKRKNVNLTKDPVTTIVGLLIIAILPILVMFGILTPEQQTQAANYLQEIVNAYSSHTWAGILSAVVGLIMMFLPDGWKKK